jgi:hypothetical protein
MTSAPSAQFVPKLLQTRLGRTYRYTRTRRSRVPFRLSVARSRCQFWADCTTNIPECKFPTGTEESQSATEPRQSSRRVATDIYGLLASTMLYPLPNTKTFDVRQMIRSKSTMVRMRSRNFQSNRC